MAEKQFAAHEHIFNEGDLAGDAYIIQSGTVEIVRQGDRGEVKLAELKEGALFGEMGLFDPTNPRSATARTLTDTVVDVITEAELRDMIGQCPPRLVPLIVSVVDRLRAASTPRARPKEAQPVTLESDIEKIIVESVAETEDAKFDRMEMPVGHLPFKIGGYPKDGDMNGASGNHLILPSDGPPLTVSRFHAEVAVSDGKLYFRDLGSRHGSLVNNIEIGRGKGIYSTPLQKGDNTVILGTKKSPYRITVRLV